MKVRKKISWEIEVSNEEAIKIRRSFFTMPENEEYKKAKNKTFYDFVRELAKQMDDFDYPGKGLP